MKSKTTPEELISHVTGAVYALMTGTLHEFSDTGDTGVIEIRVKAGKLQGVHVAKYSAAEEMGHGVRSVWKLSPEDMAELVGARRSAMGCSEQFTNGQILRSVLDKRRAQ
jgi:hypothetical protein